jgi:type IV secretion system protein VirB2
VISLAIALFLGKVSWGLAIAVAVGMGILFGAKDVVDLLSGSGTACK